MVFLFSDGLLAQTLKTACVRSAHILLVEFKFHMGYGLLYKLGYKQHTRTDSEIAFRRHFAPKERWILQKFFGFALRTQAA